MHNALARKPKRIRTAFSPSQLLRLEHAFEKNHYVVGAERKQLAHSLSLTETQVRRNTIFSSTFTPGQSAHFILKSCSLVCLRLAVRTGLPVLCSSIFFLILIIKLDISHIMAHVVGYMSYLFPGCGTCIMEPYLKSRPL